MRSIFSSWAILMVCGGILAVIVCGCGRKSESDYVPSDETVQHALESALTAWQNGKPPGVLEGTSLLDRQLFLEAKGHWSRRWMAVAARLRKRKAVQPAS